MTGWPGFAARRLLVAAGLLFVLASVTFWINQAIPYDAGYYLLGNISNPTREQVQQANERLGVDQPAFEQYGRFLSGLAHGDFGISWETASYDPQQGVVGDPVVPIVLRAAAVTGSLVLGGVVLLLVLALPLGPFLAARAGSVADRVTLTLALVFVSVHPLVTGLVLQLVVGRRLGWLPDSGYCPLLSSQPEPGVQTGGAACGGLADWATHLVLPWLAFALLFFALYLRQIRTQSLAVLLEPFVTVARAKGAGEGRVILHHVLPGVMVVVTTMVATDVGTALGVALFVEVVYGLPGLGRLLVVALQGVAGFDRPVIVGIVLVGGAAVIVATVIADLLAAVIDPRLRTAEHRAGRQRAA